MAKKTEISATEKLLEVIRGTDDSNQDVTVDLADNLKLEIEQRIPPESTPEQDTPVQPSREEDRADSADRDNPNREITAPPPESAKEHSKKVSPLKTALVGSRTKKSPFAAKVFPKKLFKSSRSIGIDIQTTHVNLAYIDPANPYPSLQNFTVLPLPESLHNEPIGTLVHNQQFIESLGTSLSIFAAPVKTVNIWVCYRQNNIQIRNITIPKVGEKDQANAVFWSTKKEIEFDPQETMYDFSIIKEILEGDQTKLLTIVRLFPRKEIEALQTLFKKLGYPLTGVTHYSVALSNFMQFNILPKEVDPTVHLHFEQEKSHIDVYSEGQMIFTRVIKTGISSYQESVFDVAAEEEIILDEQTAINLIFNSNKETYTKTPSTDHDEISSIREMLDLKKLPATERLIRQLNRTFEFCSSNFHLPQTKNLLNSGTRIFKKEFLKEIESSTGVSCSTIDIFNQRQEDTFQLPKETPDRINPLTAFGLALSNNSFTPNILWSFADKKKSRQEAKINQLIAYGTIFLAISMAVLSFTVYKTVQSKKSVYSKLFNDLEKKCQVDPRTRDSKYILSATSQLSQKAQAAQRKAKRFGLIALLKEVSEQTPSEMKLTYLRLKNSPPTENTKQPEKNSKKNGEKDRSILIRGFAGGKRNGQEFVLLDYQKRLQALPFVSNVNITSREDATLNKEKVLYFSTQITLKADLF